jgi:hypothetical protein
MEHRGSFWIVQDREWVAVNTGIPVESAYSSASNCRRSIHDVRRNLTTRLCSQIKTERERGNFWKEKFSLFYKAALNVLQSQRIYSDSDSSDGEARRDTERDEGCSARPNESDERADEGNTQPHVIPETNTAALNS